MNANNNINTANNVPMPGEHQPISNTENHKDVKLDNTNNNKKNSNIVVNVYSGNKSKVDHSTMFGRLSSLSNTLFQISILIFAIIYCIVWAVLFVVFKSRYEWVEPCDSLRNWDTALYIFYFILAGINTIFLLSHLFARKQETIAKIANFNNLRSFITGIGSLIILIGVTASYSKLNNPDICGENLSDLNLSYIIIEWVTMGISIIMMICMCCCGLIYNRLNDNK